MTVFDITEVPDYASWNRLDGVGMVVLGAGQGIGRQVAHAAHALGASVLCVDKDEDLASSVAAEVSGIPVSADIVQRHEVQRVIDTAVDAWGRIGGVVDVVGIGRADYLLDLDDEAWNWLFDVNLRHVFLTMQIAGRAMSQTGGGTLSFVSSIDGLNAAPGRAAYGAAKSALNSLVRTGALELGPLGIRVNAVAAGATLTPRLSARLTDPDKMETWVKAHPTRRLNRPADIASALMFLSSPASHNVNGQVLTVDGGFMCQEPPCEEAFDPDASPEEREQIRATLNTVAEQWAGNR